MRRLAAALVLATAALSAPLIGRAADAPVQTRETLSAQAFEDAQMATSSRAAVALAQSAARLGAGDPALSALVRERQDAESRWRAADAERVRALAQPGDKAARRAAELTTLTTATAREIEARDAEIARRYPAFAELTSPAPLPLKETQALLAADEALVFIVPAFDGTYIWAVRRDRTLWARGDMDEKAVAAAVQDLRAALDPGGAVRAAVDAAGPSAAAAGPAAFPRARAFELYGSVWAPVEPALKGAKTVYVVQTGALSALPLSVLPTKLPRGSDADVRALRATPWLFTRHALATLPAVSSLRAIRRAPDRAAAAEAFAGFGDPLLDGAAGPEAPRGLDRYYRSGSADTAAIKSLPRLPGSGVELKALAQALGAPEASVRTGAQATEAAVKSTDLSRTRVVAFATHGLLAGELGGLAEPALVLTPPTRAEGGDDGLLTASEAANLHLAADWIVLSACNTAASDGKGGMAAGGEGLSGLARAFFHAGARALLVSHWRVRDDVAARLTTTTVQTYARNPAAGRARALQAAMLDMLRRGDPAMAQPSAWAPFVVAGEAR